jgi:hypothetical protein
MRKRLDEFEMRMKRKDCKQIKMTNLLVATVEGYFVVNVLLYQRKSRKPGIMRKFLIPDDCTYWQFIHSKSSISRWWVQVDDVDQNAIIKETCVRKVFMGIVQYSFTATLAVLPSNIPQGILRIDRPVPFRGQAISTSFSDVRVSVFTLNESESWMNNESNPKPDEIPEEIVQRNEMISRIISGFEYRTTLLERGPELGGDEAMKEIIFPIQGIEDDAYTESPSPLFLTSKRLEKFFSLVSVDELSDQRLLERLRTVNSRLVNLIAQQSRFFNPGQYVPRWGPQPVFA